MPSCFFVSDLHGSKQRYEQLFEAILAEKPAAVFMGGDILPSGIMALTTSNTHDEDFLENYFFEKLNSMQKALTDEYPRIFIILGNDDPRVEEKKLQSASDLGLCEYVNNTSTEFNNFTVTGYCFVPPTPFPLKDWERYDVSRYTDPGCVSPEDGMRSFPVSESEVRWSTISKDLDELTKGIDTERNIFLFHTPPYDCNLDRAALDGKMIDHVPLDVHIGSIAVRRLIEERQPSITLHGHVHESTRITGVWRECFGRTISFNAAHDGKELSLIRFDPENPKDATRSLL